MKPNINDVFNRLSPLHIDQLFKKFADQPSNKVSKSRFRAALQEVGIVLTPGKETEMFREADIDEDGGLDRDEFVRAINVPSELEQLCTTLPLAKLLAACVEAALPSAALPSAATADRDPVSYVGDLSPQAIREVTADFSAALARLLPEWAGGLKEGYGRLDQLAADGSDGSGAKFQTIKMSAGTSRNFHSGLADRVGEQAAAAAPPLHRDSQRRRESRPAAHRRARFRC